MTISKKSFLSALFLCLGTLGACTTTQSSQRRGVDEQRNAYLNQELPGDIDNGDNDSWSDENESTESVSLNPRNKIEGIDAWYGDVN